ncbi:MAG TPA: PLDc N-terminal domain-containing protein [Intrasporangium sp.]|uniref:PLDc N-terminal domain-containing protein n=1 Tax=Intrasporangium sp. TaxID=1925024 RepID=UPI002D78912E|nr:PLDc N-terminal domain-containing protein [Intrasporangium sp.]HET7397275.1 PLDc N-terminal domain-containing protein [Intrasporangium sp.]
MLRVLLLAAVVFATIYAFVDCIQTDRRLVRVLAKPAWLLVVLVPVVGPLLWLVSGRTDARGGGPPRRPGGPPDRPTGPRGPDDDPDFLRRL